MRRYYMKYNGKKGFTLIELIVVLVILAIITAIAVPFFQNYWKRAEFRKNESNARTVYLAAESKLTYYRSSGQWEAFKKQVLSQGLQPDSEVAAGNDNIRAIVLNADSYESALADNNLVLQLLDDYSYDKEFLNAAIAIEIDLSSGEVYSAFYGTRCKGLNYKETDADGYLTMMDRAYDSRSKRLLGYYSAEDTVATVQLKPERLRITTISLQNSEKLSLNWSSNMGNSLDLSYEVSVYRSGTNNLLFSMTISPYDLRTKGWSMTVGEDKNSLAAVTVKDASGKEKGTWNFPLTYSDNKYSLVLDGMMSAKLQAIIKAASTDEAKLLELEKTYSTSITRLQKLDASLASAQDLYATVKAIPYAGTSSELKITKEYRASEVVTSNTANSMYGDDSVVKTGDDTSEVNISAFRHLSNIRYFDQTKKADFILTNKNMDWASVGTGVYDLASDSTDARAIQLLTWKENSKTSIVDFPSIPKLAKTQTLKGKQSTVQISNLQLGGDSVIDDATAEKRNAEKTKYVGLFCELEGTAEDFVLQDAHLEFSAESTETGTTATGSTAAGSAATESTPAGTYREVCGVGILAGRCSGTLQNLSITKTTADQEETVKVSLKGTDPAKTNSTAGIGSFAGVLADVDTDGTLKAPESGSISNLSAEGTVTGTIPETVADGTADKAEDDKSTVTGAENYAYGIGGMFGYAKLKNGADEMKLDGCENHAKVSGNAFTGGIVGKLDGTYQADSKGFGDDTVQKQNANIKDSSSDGMILCTSKSKAGTLEGRYFGGLVGYGNEALVYGGTSASGRAENFSYNKDKKDMLQGTYVGGIMGYGHSVLLSNCSTEKDGYILGADYVGGIAGGLGGDVNEAISASGEVAVTTNRSYVIGNSYVGGIVGKNVDKVTLKSCINNGVAAGYEKYAGGIVGYNDNATIEDCASYLSDYDSSVFNMIVKTWNAKGDYVGGIAGYNNGRITFSDTSEKITVKSVSSIVVGNNYIGGIAGFNDVNGTLDVNYTLIGGRIYAYKNCAGGAFGFNASTSALKNGLTIKPQSVEGKYYVGGIIGANVVDLTENLTMSGFATDNSLGKVVGEAFCGGLIGYQRTYTASQLGLGGTSGTTLLEKAEAMQSTESEEKLLPVLDENEVPDGAVTSQNTCQLTIAGADGGKSNTSNIALQAKYYAGGIVGYCEKDSKLVLKNCKNAGNISMMDTDSKDGVAFGNFAKEEIPGSTETSDEAKTLKLHFVGGIIGANLENQVIDNCTNVGNLSGYTGTGGIVGVNAGLVVNCQLTENFGSAGLSYLGGIAGINIGNNTTHSYAGSGTSAISYTAGTICQSSTLKNKTISGKSNVGGIAGWNMAGGVLKENTGNANINASADAAGGIAGRNSGTILMGSEATGTEAVSRSVTAKNGSGVGGIAGVNEKGGTIEITGTPEGTSAEITAVGSGVSILGKEKVGGIVGSNHGTLGTKSSGTTTVYLTCQAKSVRASSGIVGGIAGESNGDIHNAVNRSNDVTADEGLAGGITAQVRVGQKISDCTNYGNVSSSDGYAGGIAAENNGIISDCKVSGSKTTAVTIYSKGENEIGAVCADNRGIIENSTAVSNVLLKGEAKIFGGVTGINDGTVQNIETKYMPKISSTKGQLTVGGVVGENRKTISKVKADITFDSFNNYQYFGGIAGTNGTKKNAAAQITSCSYQGTIQETGGNAGNCYGGIAGINWGTLEGDSIDQITLKVEGVYTATSTSTTEQKEKLATHAGGITGKNETTAKILSCTIANNAKSQMSADYGMLGGVTGFNKGSIELSGSESTSAIMTGAETVEQLNENASKAGLQKDSAYVTYRENQEVENLSYSGGGSKVSSGKLGMYMTSNGNLGGITAYNATTGSLSKCASGKWFLVNKSNAISVGTGGIIGMNESEKDLGYLVNGAFVGRQISTVNTNRFAGGIIGNQNNTTSSDWTLEKCINYGTIYCYNSHYSGGIMGQWTGTGGTISKCVNYGNLQTTYGSAWVGASAGVVAQLYHAYEDNEYNIVSCNNYGSIYTKDGEATSNGANDSAGILGNITAYYVTKEADAQHFTVNILDCTNEPGVKIYSASMASGIVGFLSCDNPQNYNNVSIPTANIVVRIERCRNFASRLKGSQFHAGIFGDRYGKTGWKNTIVKDCYSMNMDTGCYKGGGDGRPIFGSGNNRGTAGPQNMAAENRTGNIFFEGITEWNEPRVKIKHSGTQGTSGSGTIQNQNTTAAAYHDQYAFSAYEVQDLTTGKWDFIRVDNGKTVSGSSDVIDENGIITDSNGNRKGEVLFEVEQKYDRNSTWKHFIETADESQNEALKQTRESYRRLEGVVNNKISAPEKVEAAIADGKVTLKITAQNRVGNPKDADGNVLKCDPFTYRVKVTSGNKTVVHNLYTEEGSFSIPEGMEKNATIEVTSVSMFDDVEESDAYVVKEADLNRVLPDPDVRVELVIAGTRWDSWNGKYSYKYQFSLNNLDEYNAVDENGDALYPDWKVNVTIQGVDTVTLTNNNRTGQIGVDESNTMYQMVAQATTGSGTGSMVQDSKKVSTPVCLPGYAPEISLAGITENVEVTGTTLDDLQIKVTLDASKKSATTPPVYRVELIGDWENEKAVVLAKEDVLTVSNGKASVIFQNLPEYIGKAKNLKIRMWYSASGLGPVYTYHETENASEANIKELMGVEETENGTKATWSYLHTTLEPDDTAEFGNYKYISGSAILNWLEAPKLENVDTTLTPEITADGSVHYTFQWDQDKKATETRNYEVELTGIDKNSGREVRIDVGDAYQEGENQLTVDGSDWNYTSVRLKVTRVGSSSGTKTPQIGLSSEGTYSVKQRLEQPGQMSLANTDVNELNYQISWSAISSENGCAGYQPYIQVYDGDTLGEAKALGDVVQAGTGADGIYQNSYDLEEYAGKRVVLYLVAKAEENGSYLDSKNGVTVEMEIPDRLAEPKVTWNTNWNYDKNSSMTADKFQNGGMQVNITADAGSIPPGGSTYLLKAYIYDSEDAAMSGGTPLVTYPSADGTPVQMDVVNSTNYRHQMTGLPLKYAGKWIVFYTRISSGGGNVSSKWTKSDVYRLPYVKLAAPSIASDTRAYDLDVIQTDNPDIDGEAKTWHSVQNVLTWNSVESADFYTISLRGNTVNAQGGKTPMNAEIRVLESENGVTVQQKVLQMNEQTKKQEWVWAAVPESAKSSSEENEKVHTYELDSYSTELQNSYSTANGVNITYQMKLTAALTVEQQEDGSFSYTLRLPDVVSMTANDGTSVTNSAFTMTSNAFVTADVQANQDGKSSDVFHASDASEVRWNN